MGRSNREVVEEYARALAEDDLDAQDAVLHDDYMNFYPQSGERMRGRATHRAILENYPGGHVRPEAGRIIGSEDQWVTTPSWTVVHFSGSGDNWVVTGKIRYPNGEEWHAVLLLELRDGKISRETNYFAPPFEAPEWRARYVERS